jgi:hypothetical protein
VRKVKMATASKSSKRRLEIVENNENSAEVVSRNHRNWIRE